LEQADRDVVYRDCNEETQLIIQMGKYLGQSSNGRKQRSIGQEARAAEQLQNARTQPLQSACIWILCAFNNPCQAQRSTHLHMNEERIVYYLFVPLPLSLSPFVCIEGRVLKEEQERKP
jgi:hypothetical protein